MPECHLEQADDLAGRFEVLGAFLRLDVIDTLLDRGVLAGLGSFGDPRRHRVEIGLKGRRCKAQGENPGATSV